MKKQNRIMLKAVAILLCLVLFTTCIVSSTFAKFANRQTATTNMTLGRFGVEISLTPNGITKNTEDKRGNSLSTTFKTVSLKPGDAKAEAVKMTFSGTPNVDTRIIIDFELDYNLEPFTIYKTDFYDLATDSAVYVPIGFKVHKGTKMPTTGNCGYVDGSRPYRSNTAAETEEAIERALATSLGFEYHADGYVYKEYRVENHPTISETTVIFGFGIGKDFDTHTSNKDGIKNTDAIGTWIAEKLSDEAPITAIYTIKAEQITN